VGACKINTGSVLVLRALSPVFLAVTEKHAEAGNVNSLFNYSYGIIVGACKINTGIVLVLTALSSVFLAVTEKHVPRLVMIIHCLIIVGACKINTGSVLVLRALSSVFLVVTEKTRTESCG